MPDNNLQVNDLEQQDKVADTNQLTEKVASQSDEMPENKVAVPKEAPVKQKLSEWTEVTGQTLAQLKEKAKITFDQLTPGSKEKK